MSEAKTAGRAELRLKGSAEEIFRFVDELRKKIAKIREGDERQALLRQANKKLTTIREVVRGKKKSTISPEVLDQIREEYFQIATHLEEADVEAARLDNTDQQVEQLAKRLLDRDHTDRLGHLATARVLLNTLVDIDQNRSRPMPPAWRVFVLDTWEKLYAFNGHRSFDDWYAEAMGKNDQALKKLVLPLVAMVSLNAASIEGSRPMPSRSKVMEERHRAQNALQELVELWQAEVPAVADKYQAIVDNLDQELITLAEYHRYQSRL